MGLITARARRRSISTVTPITTSVTTSIAAAIAAGLKAAALVPGGIETRALLANDRLGLDGVHFGFVQVIGAGDQHAQDFIAELHVALDSGDRAARGLEEGDDVRSALLALDLVGQLALIPLLDHDD